MSETSEWNAFNAQVIEEFRANTRFVRVSGATVVENHPHDIRITKESPNYTHDS